MPDLSLARNADVGRILTTVAVAVDDAQDISFFITQCTAFKLQGSMDGGSTYNDILGSSSLLGASGTLTASLAYCLSLTKCRFDHVKPVFSGTNPTVIYCRNYIRQSPKVGLDSTLQCTIIDPIAGTA